MGKKRRIRDNVNKLPSLAKNYWQKGLKIFVNHADVQMRAFDWADFLLYLIAIFFIIPLLVVSLGKVPWEIFNNGSSVELVRHMTEQDKQARFRLPVFISSLFVIFVYLRNYSVMHQIDNRKAYKVKKFGFVDNNRGGFYRGERFFRALIILWVVTSIYNLFAPITRFVLALRDCLLVNENGLYPITDIATYYCTVLVILFIFCIFYDLTNVWAVDSAIKNNQLSKPTRASDRLFMEFMDGTGVEFYHDCLPIKMKKQPAVYSILAYIKPSLPMIGVSALESEGKIQERMAQAKLRAGKIKNEIESAKLRLTYLKGLKFRERIFGIISALLLIRATQMGATNEYVGVLRYALLSVICIFIYFYSLGWKEILPTILVIPKYLGAYFLDNRRG